jgi:hypothetical protein
MVNVSEKDPLTREMAKALAPERVVARQLCLDIARPPQISTRPFRAELTLEQQSLFVADTYKGDSFERTLTMRDPATGGTITTRQIVGKMNPSDRGRGVLRQSHQDVLYKLYALWGSLGYPTEVLDAEELGVIRMTVYGLLSELFPGDDSARRYRRAQTLLQDLKGIPITLDNVYSYNGLVGSEPRTILKVFDWRERKVDPDTRIPAPGGSSSVLIMFNKFITDAFKARHTRILLAKTYESLGGRGKKSGIARLLYPYLDRELELAPHFAETLSALAARFELHRHQHKSKRREQFASAVSALQGVLCVEGRYRMHVEIRDAQDDYALCVERRALEATRSTAPSVL